MLDKGIFADEIPTSQTSQESLITTDEDTTPEEILDPNMAMMKKIADNQQSLEEIKMLTSSKVTDQLKVFLISQARNELSRVIKLTQFLDKLEENFMDKASKAMVDDNLTLKQYSEVIGVITSLLARSSEIVTRVLKDDSLMTILNTTIYSSDNGSQMTSVVTQLKDSQSRERVRVVLQQIINRSKEYIPESETQQSTEVAYTGIDQNKEGETSNE